MFWGRNQQKIQKRAGRKLFGGGRSVGFSMFDDFLCHLVFILLSLRSVAFASVGCPQLWSFFSESFSTVETFNQLQNWMERCQPASKQKQTFKY